MMSLTWEEAWGPWPAVSTTGTQVCLGQAPDPTVIEIQSQGPGWVEAQLVRVWRGPEEVSLQINLEGWKRFYCTDVIFLPADSILSVKMCANGCVRKYAYVKMDMYMRAKINRSA